MTIERPRARVPRTAITLSPFEWRLGAATLLTTTYLTAFISLASKTPTEANGPVSNPATTAVAPNDASSRRTAVWYGALPVTERPVVALPTGYRLVDPNNPSPSVARTVTSATAGRVAVRRPIRVRTRSS